MIFRLDERLLFPDPELAEEDGLLAVGGDLSPQRLLLAYQSGIFPWFSDDDPILWYSPHERFVFFPDKIKVSKSMRKVLASGQFTVTFDKAFADVIRACAAIPRKHQHGTWITSDMIDAYIALHQLGHTHSVEVWQDDELVGGLYGVVINKVFCGESMFSRVANASKAALLSLCQSGKYNMVDCQLHTDHLESMGAEMIGRKEYMEVLQSSSPGMSW